MTENRTKKYIRLVHFILSLVFIMVSFGLSIFVFTQDRLLARTLSNIGLHNNVWFIIWSICFSLACMINLETLKLKIGIKGIKGILLTILLSLILPLAIIQAVIIDYRVNALHIYLAIVFTSYGLTMIIGFMVLLTIIKTRSNKKLYKRGFLYFLILAVPGLSNFWAINHFGLLIAAFQIALIYACLIVVFLMQILEKWS